MSTPNSDGAQKKRSFPRVSLKRALELAQAIKEKNAGNPWEPAEIAKALKVGAKTGPYFYLTAAARDYGITDGTRDSEKIELTELGRSVIYPESAEAALDAKVQAFVNVESFRKVLQHYRGNNLPEMEYLSNTLKKEFGIPEALHEEFVKLFRENCTYLNIGATLPAALGGPEAGQRRGGDTFNASPATVTLGKPAKGSGKLCFVIMPFTERDSVHSRGFFQEVLKSLIVPAATEAGFEVRSANRMGSDVIQSTIIKDLLKADLVVADLTEHNPNVLFELGMRMSEDKPVALIKASGTARIFDVDNMLRVLEYNSCLWPSTVAADLPQITAHIKATWDNRETDVTYMGLLREQESRKAARGS